MKLFISLEIDVNDSSLVKDSSVPIDSFINMLKLHTSHVVSNFEGRLVKFDIEKA